jgi:TonB-linked SusC/RagA family outer membrane protein
LGWNIGKESFMSNIAAISNLKLRGSWGKAGNDKIGDYAYASTLTSNMYYVFVDPADGERAFQGTTPNGSPNPDLKWEETTMTNIGLDLALFENRFTLAAEYFINKSDDLLMPAPLANSIGDWVGSISQNAGSVQTKGVELVIGYNDFEGDFQWSANLNLGTSKNEVLSLGKATVLAGGAFENNNLTRCEVGQPAFFFYGYTFDGIFQTDQEAQDYMGGTQYAAGARAGDFRIVDRSGDDAIGTADRGNIGNPFPKLTLGFDLNANYKGFDVNVFITGAYGQDVYNTNIWDLEGMDRLFNAGTAVLDRWTPTNPSNSVPRPGNLSNLAPSTRFVQDGSYTRLKNITLGYTIPSSILKNKISKLRVYVSGQNLITLTKYEGLDPEIGANSVSGTGVPAVGGRGTAVNFANGIDYGTYPMPKSFTAGVQLTF